MKDVKTMTRAKAQRMIAGTTDREVIKPFLKHGNSHIQKYAAHKLEALELASDEARIEKERKEEERKARRRERDRARREAKKQEKENAA